MGFAARISGLMIVAAPVLWSWTAIAGEPHNPALDMSIPDASMPTSSSDRQPTAEDLSARIDQLEADRASLDQKSKSPISLSVSGWVSQQVTVTRP